MEEDIMLHLPNDIIYKILKHLPDPASLARLASSCKFWRNLIKDSTYLDRLRRRHSDHGFSPSLLFGFFYHDKSRSDAPSFMPMSELSRFIGNKHIASLSFYEPIASQDSFLALRRPQSLTDVLCVCNPLTGEIFGIPSLGSEPTCYSLLVTDNVDLDGHISQSFQLVATWVTSQKKFRCLCYSSNTGIWGLCPGAPELMHGLYVVSSPAAASHGAIHWLCGSWKNWTLTHIATLHVDTQKLSYLELPSEAKRNKVPPLLSNSADGGLLLLFVKGVQMTLWKQNNSVPSGNTNSWVLSETIDMASSMSLDAVKPGPWAKVRLEIFPGKSGAVVFWVEGEGLFLFSLSDGSVKKIHSERLTKEYHLCPYEIDWLSCLAVTNLTVEGSLSLDLGRKKVRDRWRALMTNKVTKPVSSE